MIAFGTPFIAVLKEAGITLNQYFMLYCYVYEKKHLLNEYNKNVEPIPIDNLTVLKKKGFLIDLKGKWMSTDRGEEFIKDMVDSFSDQRSDNPLLGDEDLVSLENVYEAEFEKFLNSYPVKIRRANGMESYLKEGTKEIRDLYISIVKSNRATTTSLQLAIDYYVKRYTDNGNTAYMKTLKNWLSQDIWKDVINYMDSPNFKTQNSVNYGGKIE